MEKKKEIKDNFVKQNSGFVVTEIVKTCDELIINVEFPTLMRFWLLQGYIT
jgi:hypothetical protein